MSLEFEADGVPVEKLPIPCGWRLLIAPVKLRDKTEGGIALPQASLDIANNFRNIAKVLAIGSNCYDDPSFRGGQQSGTANNWCNVGDIIAIAPHDGQSIKIRHDGKDHTLKFINDRNVVSVIHDISIIESLL